jgi:hypothetical protein
MGLPTARETRESLCLHPGAASTRMAANLEGVVGGVALGNFCTALHQATTSLPYPYQKRLATDGWEGRLIRFPKGHGKTAAVFLGWLWEHRTARTSCRLGYCLPIGLLAEQTRECGALTACDGGAWGDETGARPGLARQSPRCWHPSSWVRPVYVCS